MLEGRAVQETLEAVLVQWMPLFWVGVAELFTRNL